MFSKRKLKELRNFKEFVDVKEGIRYRSVPYKLYVTFIPAGNEVTIIKNSLELRL